MKMITLILGGLMFLQSCSNQTKSEKTTEEEKDSRATENVTTAPPEEKPETNTTKSEPTWKELASGQESSQQKPMNQVITSQKQLDELWAKAFKDGMQEKPRVDFSTNSIIAIFLGQVKSGGHSLEISSIKSDGAGGYTIEATHKLPGKSCISSQAIEYPFYMATTEPALSGKTTFKMSNKEVECE